MNQDTQQIQAMVVELCETYKQKQLSLLVNIPQGTLSKIKNGKLGDFSHKKADAIRNFYFNWKKQKTSAGQS